VTRTEIDGDWEICEQCGGSGKDRTEVDGRCVHCFGRGEIFCPYPEPEDYDGEECP
jgi:hypothetical protein